MVDLNTFLSTLPVPVSGMSLTTTTSSGTRNLLIFPW